MLHGHHDGNILFAGPPAAALAQIEDVSRREIYASSRRIRADLQAHKVISTLLEAYLGAFLEREMVGRPSGSGSDILTTFPHAEGAPLDKPSYVRATLDYVSGMTDRFAINCAKFLAGAASG